MSAVTRLAAGVAAIPVGAAVLLGGLVASVSTAQACGSGTGQLGSSQIGDAEAKLGVTLPFSREYAQWGGPIKATAGHTPMISVKATGRWSAIANGSQDGAIRRQAAQVIAIPGTVYLALHHEPENDPTLGTPADYAAAWKRYVTVYKAAGVTNVRWTWILMADSFNGDGAEADSFYPGDDTVDVTAADGYNWHGSKVQPGAPRSFEQIFAGLHSWSAAHGKPALVAEFGMVPGPTRAAWITDASATAKTWGLTAAVYYHAREFQITADAVPALKAWAGGSSTPSSAPTAGTLSGVQVAQAAQAAGFPADQLAAAVAVAKAESSWNPDATHSNTNGSTDLGLWQINSVHKAILATGEWSDPQANARMAKAVWNQQGWPAWVTWSTGAYRQHLPEAEAAVAQLGVAPVATPTAAQSCVPSETVGLGGGPVRAAAVTFAIGQLGDPYVWGGTGPDGWDCSGLVLKAYASAGITVPRTAGEQMQASQIVPPETAQTGDLLFSHVTASDAGHVKIIVSVSGGIAHTVHAPQTGDVVKLADVPLAGAVVGRVAL